MISARCCGLSGSSIGWRGEPDVLAHVFRRRALHMRRLHPQPLPVLVHPPAQRRRPGEAALDQRHLELREALEHALEHEARQRVLHAGGRRVMLLHVIGRPARAGRGVAAAEALHVQRDRLVGALRRLEDRPVAAVAERVARPRRDDDLRERRIAGARRRSRCTAKAASSCGTTMPARSRGSGLTKVSSCHSLMACDSAAANSRLRSSMPPLESCISMPTSTPLASRCCRRIRSRSEPGGPSSGKASTRRPDARHARPGELAGQALPQVLAEGRHVLAPARRQERIEVRRLARTPDGCRNRRW